MESLHPDGERPHHGIVLPNWAVDGDPGALVEYAVEAEAAGWDGVFLADHLICPPTTPEETPEEYQPFPDPWITLAGVAARTDEIRLGSWITPVPRRQPWQLARDLATLDRLSDGRVILGTGLGRSSDYLTFGEEWVPRRLGQRYDEALEIIAGLWSGEPFSYDGDHYTVEETVLLPTPAQQPRIPIVVGGLWPNEKPFHRGARWDGIIPHYPGDGIMPEDGVDGLMAGTDADPMDEVRAMLDYYHDIADDAGVVFLPADPPHPADEWLQLCRDYDVDWLYTRPRDSTGTWELSTERIRRGPPG